MKEVTIDAEIWHGEYRKKLTASAGNITNALKKLGKMNGYCTQTEEQIGSVLCQLVRRGRGDMGWVIYTEVK